MEASELKEILDQHRLWIDGRGGSRADLTGADLHRANLRGANLYGAILTRANLGGAILTRANLEGANLEGANLEGANLGGAILYGANLHRANLEGADLQGAYLTGANLHRANLEGADLQGANLTSATLTGAIGLPHVSWIIPGCLVQLNQIKFYLEKERKHENFVQDSIGFFIQDNLEEKTFDMLLGDRIIRNIPDWVKLSGLNKIVLD